MSTEQNFGKYTLWIKNNADRIAIIWFLFIFTVITLSNFTEKSDASTLPLVNAYLDSILWHAMIPAIVLRFVLKGIDLYKIFNRA